MSLIISSNLYAGEILNKKFANEIVIYNIYHDFSCVLYVAVWLVPPSKLTTWLLIFFRRSAGCLPWTQPRLKMAPKAVPPLRAKLFLPWLRTGRRLLMESISSPTSNSLEYIKGNFPWKKKHKKNIGVKLKRFRDGGIVSFFAPLNLSRLREWVTTFAFSGKFPGFVARATDGRKRIGRLNFTR